MTAQPNTVIEKCGSTNDLAKQLGENGAPHGTWISARAQDQGRGRLGREWQSGRGNLFLSMIARMGMNQNTTWIPLTAAVAVVSAIREQYPDFDLRIKWPNDLWAFSGRNSAKLGGILCEGVGTPSSSFIVIGLGLNCTDSPKGLDQPTTSLTEVIGEGMIRADDVREDIILALNDRLNELMTTGPAGIGLAYERWAAFPRGTPITWGEGEGTVLGLGAASELLVELPNGTCRSLYAEDVKIRPAR